MEQLRFLSFPTPLLSMTFLWQLSWAWLLRKNSHDFHLILIPHLPSTYKLTGVPDIYLSKISHTTIGDSTGDLISYKTSPSTLRAQVERGYQYLGFHLFFCMFPTVMDFSSHFETLKNNE